MLGRRVGVVSVSPALTQTMLAYSTSTTAKLGLPTYRVLQTFATLQAQAVARRIDGVKPSDSVRDEDAIRLSRVNLSQ